jgi:hypothetical protein
VDRVLNHSASSVISGVRGMRDNAEVLSPFRPPTREARESGRQHRKQRECNLVDLSLGENTAPRAVLSPNEQPGPQGLLE